MEQSDNVDLGTASARALSEAPLLVESNQEYTAESKPSDVETVVSSSEAVSAATSVDLKIESSLSIPVKSGSVILDETDVSPVSKTTINQSSPTANEENLPMVSEVQPSPLESDASRCIPSVADCPSQPPDPVLSGRESGASAVETDSITAVNEGNQPFRNETSGDLNASKLEQDVESGEKMDIEPTQNLPTKSSSELETGEMDVEETRPASNGPVSSEQEKPNENLSESLVSGIAPTVLLDMLGKENVPEKTVKRSTEVECMAEKPTKRQRKNDLMFSVPDAVEAVLCSTAEIVVVLAGMAQMRAGRPFTSLEKDLAAVACQNIASLVSKVAPNALVSKEALEKMICDLNSKRMAQTRIEDHARAKALAEAESKAKADAMAKAKAEELARMKAEAEAEERKQAAMRAAQAAAVTTSPTKDVKPMDGLTPPATLPPPATPPDQPAQESPPPVELNISSATPLAPPSIQAHVAAQAHDVSQSEAIPEKPVVDSSPSQQSSKAPMGKPPKVRKTKKDSGVPTLLSPDYLEYIQSAVPEPQKAQVTHKQLCLAVQQFIQEQMPLASQILEAIPPSYINTPSPCQICKLIAKETLTVMVCDSCDKLFHMKCIQPNGHTKSVSKGDWNCPSCLSGGRSYREKYGSYRRGSVSGVKLWAPHETSEDNIVLNRASETVSSDRRNSSVSDLTLQSKLTVDVERASDTIKDDRITGNYGSSPHLIVHLVNEPSPRTKEQVQNSSVSYVGGDDMGGSLSSGSQLKLTSRAGSGDSGTMTGGAGNVRPNIRDSEDGDGDVPASNSQIGTSGRSADQGNSDILTNFPGKQVEVPLIVEWVGESTRTVEGKTYYRSCRVGGQTYHLADCALFRPETPDVPPYIARLQVLWEDLSTSHKWVRVSWCYYPSDIPLTMGRPGRVEPDEVYESNHCDNNLVGSIQGPCLVLPAKKYRKELERRRELQNHGGVREGFPPVFLSRWLYDAPKGVFKHVTE